MVPPCHHFELCEQLLWLYDVLTILSDTTFSLSVVTKEVSVQPLIGGFRMDLILEV